MTQKRLDPATTYDKTDAESILRHAARLTGKTLNGLIGDGELVINGTNNKGLFGQIVEEGYFLIENNSSPLPDFQDVGIELKVAPMKKTSKGFVSKERLILGLINYNDVPKRHFRIFLDKDSRILIVFYFWQKDRDVRDFRFLKVVDWRPSSDELRIFREDWEVIEGYIMRGEAHLLSERHTRYLAACTKGVGHGRDMRTQPFSTKLAKQRALSFKASFMTELYRNHADIGEILVDDATDDTTSILQGGWSLEETFEEHVVRRLDRFVGKTCGEIEEELGVDLSSEPKQYYYMLVLSMFGVTKKKHIKEFVEAGITIKTVRITLSGTPKESTSFPAFRSEEIVKQSWEESNLFNQIDREFFISVFQFRTKHPKKEDRKSLLFKGAFFWYVPDDDMEIIRGVWEDTKRKILEGRFDDFVKISDHRIAHVRPHGKPKDIDIYKGKRFVKKGFWFNNAYMMEVIRFHLGNQWMDDCSDDMRTFGSAGIVPSHPVEPPLNDGVVKSMKGNKGKGTKPELIVRKALREAGYPGYRLNWGKAPGHPDICYPGMRVAVFVNGCFWHQCPICRPHLPRHNSDYWIPKLRRNVERDAEKTAALEEEGWTVVVVWECELKKNLDVAISRIVSALESSRSRIS